MAPQPAFVIAHADAAGGEQGPEALRVVVDLEVRHLVLDHIVEDLRRSQKQPPVEAHRPVRRAAGPASALAADLQAGVGRARPAHGAIKAPGHLVSCLAAKPAFQSVLDRLAPVLPHAYAEGVSSPRHVGTHPAGLYPHREDQSLAQVGHFAAVFEAGRRSLGFGFGHPPQSALDPPAFLFYERLHLPQGQPTRHHHLDPVRGHLDAGPPGSVGTADAVGDGGHTPKIRFGADLVKDKSPTLLALIGALAIGAVAMAIALASDSGNEKRGSGPTARVTPAGGGFRGQAGQTSAVLAVRALRPGQTAAGSVRLRNEGQSPGLFTLSRTGANDRPGPNGGRLSERLQLEVLDVTARGRPKVVYTGGVAALDTRPLGVLAPGDTRLYEVRATALRGQTPTVPLGGGYAYEGSTARISFRWQAMEGLPPTRLASLLGPLDRTGPKMTLVVAPRQSVIQSGRVAARLRCDEPCRASASATVALDSPKRLKIELPSGPRRGHRVLVALPRQTQDTVRSALEAGQTVPILLRLEATDREGNRSSLTDTLRLQPRS